MVKFGLLIPVEDELNSWGQRLRKAEDRGTDPERVNWANRPFQGRLSVRELSGCVAPGYLLLPFQGMEFRFE
jgi:hypothetical protein